MSRAVSDQSWCHWRILWSLLRWGRLQFRNIWIHVCNLHGSSQRHFGNGEFVEKIRFYTEFPNNFSFKVSSAKTKRQPTNQWNGRDNKWTQRLCWKPKKLTHGKFLAHFIINWGETFPQNLFKVLSSQYPIKFLSNFSDWHCVCVCNYGNQEERAS